jgi:hypothetical protein
VSGCGYLSHFSQRTGETGHPDVGRRLGSSLSGGVIRAEARSLSYLSGPSEQFWAVMPFREQYHQATSKRLSPVRGGQPLFRGGHGLVLARLAAFDPYARPIFYVLVCPRTVPLELTYLRGRSPQSSCFLSQRLSAALSTEPALSLPKGVSVPHGSSQAIRIARQCRCQREGCSSVEQCVRDVI